jgi:energy-coupling factor transporter ATP-binding protein EcfA2
LKIKASLRYDAAPGADAAAQAQQILKGAYRYDSRTGAEELLFDGMALPINLTSSGQQEAVWILNLLLDSFHEKCPTCFIIEEPESHLYPDAQNEMMQFIAHIKNAGHQMLITTHSPYVLGSVNNLLYAHQVGQLHPSAAEKLVPKAHWLDPATFLGLHMQNGLPVSAMDAESLLFRNELIDGAAESINEVFEALLELKYAVTQEDAP